MNKNYWKDFVSGHPYNYQAVLSFRFLRGNPSLRAAEHAEAFYRAINNQVFGKRWEKTAREAFRIHIAAALERKDLNWHLQSVLQVPEQAMEAFEANIKPVWCRKTRAMFHTALPSDDACGIGVRYQPKAENERGNCVFSRLPTPDDGEQMARYIFKEVKAHERLWFSGFLPTDISYNFPGDLEPGMEKREGPRDL